MIVKLDVLNKYLELAARDQLQQDYESKGFEIREVDLFGSPHADLIMQKNEKVIVFEFKTQDAQEERLSKIMSVRANALKKGARFELVFVRAPEPPDILIEELDSILFNLLTEEYQSLYDTMSTHTTVDSVDDIEYKHLEITRERILVVGDAHVSFDLQFGSASDQREDSGYITSEGRALRFNISISKNLEVLEVEELYLEN